MRSNENGGGDVGYYVVQIDHPKRFKPCVVECEDVIAALGLDFFEGEAFKALWRKGAQRTLGVGKSGNTALRDAQKVAHYGARCLALEEQRGIEPVAQVPPVNRTGNPQLWETGDHVRFIGDPGWGFAPGEVLDVAAVGSGRVLFEVPPGDGSRGADFTFAADCFEWTSRP